MSIHTGRTPKHWNYFLAIENDVEELSKWIDFHKDNFGCFSIQIARLLMITSAETDVVAKRLCKIIDPDANASSINRYREVIIKKYPNFHQTKVKIPRYALTLKPWSNWSDTNKPPNWWQANNKVKHHRNVHFNKARLEHALNSVAGLLLLLSVYYGLRLPSVTPAPSLLVPQNYAYIDGTILAFHQ